MSIPKLAAKSARKPRSAAEKPRKATDDTRQVAAARMRRRYAALSPAEKTEYRWRLIAKPATPRAGSTRSTEQRAVSLALAFCDWSDLDEVVSIFRAAALMTELTGVPYEVSHIVPLNHPLVCGLHTHTNLEVVTLAENRLKSNLFWPGMWEYGEIGLELIEMQLEQQQGDRLQAANDEKEHPGFAAGVGPGG